LSTTIACAWARRRARARGDGPRRRTTRAEQAPELALVRREDRRRLACGQRAQVAGVGVEAVGVEHDGHLGARDEFAGEGEGAVAAPEARSHHERTARWASSSTVSDARWRCGRRRPRAAARHRLEQPLGEDRLRGGGDAGGDVAGAGALGGLGGQRRRAGEPARAARDEHVPARELRPPGRARGQQREQLGIGHEGDVGIVDGRARRDADVDHAHRAAVRLARG
jgi:hypothetical protein